MSSRPPRSPLFPYTTLFRSEIIKAIHSLSPDAADATAAVARRVRDRNPSALELYSRAVANNLGRLPRLARLATESDRKSTRLNSSHSQISYAVFCLKKKKQK